MRLPTISHLLLILILPVTAESAAIQCPTPEFDETVTVRYVQDGDTLILGDERKLRLLGYDTPEIERRGRAAQPLGHEARQQLSLWIAGSSQQIGLQYDVERKDRYGRMLAHAFLKNGYSIAALMLQDGLAASLIIPPNMENAGCYMDAEDQARAQKRGIWKLPAYQVATLTRLESHRDRYTVLQAKVSALEQNNRGFILRLGSPDTSEVEVFIENPDLELFLQTQLKTLQGREIEVRGWLHRRHKVWTLQLRHPSNLKIL
ncbi:MAG TPA: thermonuclease family protein [Gammaproteobacteria bacterium]